jgi:AraC-like DNA-binding protein
MLGETGSNLSVAAVRLVEAALSAQAGDRENAEAHIAHALALLHGDSRIELPAVQQRVQAARPIPRGGLAKWRARRLSVYIDSNLSAKVQIKDLATLAGLSPGHLCRAFRHTFGVPPHVYIHRRRIELSQALLLTTSDTISEIALRCGMSDQSHLTRAFRRMVGETPRSWRRDRQGVLKVDAPGSVALGFSAESG